MKLSTGFSLGAALSALLLAGCAKTADDVPVEGQAAQTTIQTPATPTTAKAEKRDIVGYALMEATLYTPPTATAHVYATFQGPVDKIMTSEGQRVRKGEALIDLGEPGRDASYEQARTTLDSAQSALRSAEAQLQGPVREAERRLREARTMERLTRLETVPGGDAFLLDDATAERKAAEEGVTAAKAQARTELIPYQQQFDVAWRAFREARSNKKDTILSAPISGVVTKLNVQLGQDVGANKTALAEITDLAALRVKAKVLPPQAPLVTKETDVVVLFNDFPDKHLHGNVANVQPLPADAGGGVVYEATIWFSNEDGLVKPGMSVKHVGVEIGKANDVLTVPMDAVAKDETGRPYVNKLVNENWTKTIVEVGLSDGYFVQIKDGELKAGDTVQVIPNQGVWMRTLPPTK